MDYFVAQMLPIILHLTQMRQLELQESGGPETIKSKKYETLIVQLWQLLPLFCKQNSANMYGCLAKLLPRLDQLLNGDEMGLRATALKTFSSLIGHCKVTKVVDA